MPLRYKTRLIRHLRHETYSPATVRILAEDLGVSSEDFDEFAEAVRQLAEVGEVVYGDNQVVTLPPMGKEIIGVFRRNPKGFGFVIPRQSNLHGDLFVPPDATLDALSGDLVRVQVVRSRRGGGGAGRSPFTGEIVEVIERKRTEFAGELMKRGGQWIVQPDGKGLSEPVIVRDPSAKNAVEGDKVVFELVRRPEGNMIGEGAILRVLGKTGEPDVETQAVIAAYGLPQEFPDGCLSEAREATEAFDAELRAWEKGGRAPEGRLDLTGDFIITIDPPDAKDYDDAISISRVGDGWTLGVHIADVAHFIAPGSALDEEASERGNSVYLPRLVIPMLPETLSNGICSLQEGVLRFCKSAFMEYDASGRVRRQGFASTVIKSVKRLTYLEAQALIDGNPQEAERHAKTEARYTPELLEALRMMHELSKTILARRMKQGMIRLDLPEVELIFDEKGRVVDAVPEDDAYTHTLIEMFMVEANEAVARLFEDLRVPLLRRVHEEPVPGEIDELRRFAMVAGFRIPKSPSREELQGLLEATRGTPASKAVHFAVLRSLTKANYSPAMVGHFALASEAYAHFTSPIRRYPDLTVHRALRAFLEATKNGREAPKEERDKRALGLDLRRTDYCPDEQVLRDIGARCTQTEVNASDAENELRQFLVLQLLSEHIGEVFEGVVTGMTGNGVFVQIEKYLAEGMVKAGDLPVASADEKGKTSFRTGGRWKIDPRSGALVEQNTGRSFSIGDRVDVVIAAIDLPARKMDLLIADPEARARGKSKTPQLKLGGGDAFAGGLGGGKGAGFRTGADRRSAKSRSRDKGKKDYRNDRKGKR